MGLNDRYERLGKPEDLDQAIEACQRAVQGTPDTSPSLPINLTNLGNGLRARYVRTAQPDDLHKAIKAYEEACQRAQYLASEAALTSAYNWGTWAMERTNWIEAARAYAYGVKALERIYRVQLLRTSQNTWLSEVGSLHARAAYTMARAGHLREAVVALEQGRARGLSETLARDRADLERIQQIYPRVYDRYQQAVERLRLLERAEREGNKLSTRRQIGMVFTLSIEQIQQARQELEHVISRIRHLPGYANFLAEPTYDAIVQAAHPHMPLVYLVTTSVGSLALFVHTAIDMPEVIWADTFTETDLNAMLVKYDKKMVVGGYLPGQLFNSAWLNEALLKDISRLGELLIGSVANHLHKIEATGILLIPIGRLGLLPLHAAPYQSNGRKTYLLDEFDVAYTPSVRVLTTIERELQARQIFSPHLVGISNPLPTPEVGSWAQTELQRIAPALQQTISAYEPHPQIQTLIAFLERSLHRLQALSQESPEQMLYAGQDLLHIAISVAILPGLPSDIATTLTRLAESIPPNLSYAHSELESIVGLFPKDEVAAYYEHQATRDALWNALPQATMAHFACHGGFNLDIPLDSALLLARETHLTLRDLLNAEPERLGAFRKQLEA